MLHPISGWQTHGESRSEKLCWSNSGPLELRHHNWQPANLTNDQRLLRNELAQWTLNQNQKHGKVNEVHLVVLLKGTMVLRHATFIFPHQGYIINVSPRFWRRFHITDKHRFSLVPSFLSVASFSITTAFFSIFKLVRRRLAAVISLNKNEQVSKNVPECYCEVQPQTSR